MPHIRPHRIGKPAAADLFLARPLPAQAGTVAFQCPQATILAFAEWLVAQGAQRVSVQRADYVFTSGNALAERLERRIG